MVYLEIGVRFGKNNSHLASLKFIWNAVTYPTYVPLPFKQILPSNITILFPNKLELEGEIKYV